jgi:hypothetical protein
MSSLDRFDVADSVCVERSGSTQAGSSIRPGNSPTFDAIRQDDIPPQAGLGQDQEEILRAVGTWSSISSSLQSEEC